MFPKAVNLNLPEKMDSGCDSSPILRGNPPPVRDAKRHAADKVPPTAGCNKAPIVVNMGVSIPGISAN